jgi:hypothetical protein
LRGRRSFVSVTLADDAFFADSRAVPDLNAASEDRAFAEISTASSTIAVA